jgi:DNA-binding transcriptional ArsR family regulator
MTQLAGLLADHTRASICLALLDGRRWTAGELARHAGVAASTATEHISLLVEGGLLIDERQGRHRYVCLAGWEAAHLIEDLAGYTAPATDDQRSLRAVTTRVALARARTCYDHLAGRLGVLVTDALTRSGHLDQSAGFALTPGGRQWLAGTVDLPSSRTTRRPLVRACIDWTERRPHLAGLAGALLCQQFLAQRWVVRIKGQRALRVTCAGRDALLSVFGVEAAAIEEADFDVLYD